MYIAGDEDVTETPPPSTESTAENEKPTYNVIEKVCSKSFTIIGIKFTNLNVKSCFSKIAFYTEKIYIHVHVHVDCVL